MGIENHVPKEMQDAVREILAGRHIGYLGAVHHEVKPDRFENRLLALTEYRLFVLHYKVPTKVESNIFYLDLQSIRSPSTKSLVFGTGQRNLTFNCQENDTRGFDAALHYVIKSLVTVFPSVPLERVLPKLTLSASRLTGVNEQVKQLQQKEPGPCGGFSTTYKCTSDYHGNLFLDEVAWDIDTIYLSHDSHHLNIGDFDHLEPRHLPPLISALEHNTWFTGITAENIAKLGPDAQREIVKVMRKNVTIEELCLSNSGIRWDFVQQLSQSLMTNANSPLSKLDLSSNAIEDKGMNAMHQPITQLSRGLTHLDLSRTAITARGVNRLAEALQANKFMSTTLQYLNLSDNLLKGEELANLFNFLAQPNAVIELNLSGTECALEGLFGALLRGCTTKLQYLRVARNVFTHRKGRDWQVPKAWHRFLASSFSLKLLDLAETRLPLEAVKMVLLGIGSNINENHVELILSGNGLGMAGPEFIQTSLSNLNYISSLDLSDNAFDNLIPLLAEHLAHSRHLKKLHIGKNFSGIKPKNMTQVLEALVQLVQDEDVGMEMLSLADSKLKLDTVVIINALGGNVSLTEIDITGNHMGDIGARMLAKALQINTYLQVVHWDKNNTTPQGLTDVASALEKNFSMRKMPTPVVDSAVAIRLNTEKTTKALCKIENLLQRNHSPRKFASDQAFRLQQGLLLSSTQQMVDQLVLQVQDSLKRILRVGVSADAQSDVKRATAFVKEAEKATQILPRLQEVAMQFEMEGNPIHRNLQSLAANLHTVIENQLKKNLSYMLKCTEDQCPTIMTEKALRSELEQACTDKSYLADGFTQSLMVEQVGTDVTNKVGELNLAVAAHISESVVDSVLRSLESSNKILLRHLKTASLRPSVSESIKAEEADSVSPFRKKETTLIAAPPESLKVSTLKRRSRRPQSVIVDIQEDTRSVDTIDSLDASTLESSLDNSSRGSTPSCDAVSSPSKSRRSQSSALDEELDSVAPLDPSGPKLQHLAKARPKRAKTRAMSKAVLSNEEMKTEGPDVVEFFSTKPVNTVPISPPPSSKQKTPKITPEPKHKANKQEKDDVIAPKKKGWSPSLPTIPTKGLTGLFHKKNTHSSPETSRKNQEESSDRSGAKTPDRDRKEAKTPDRSKTPDLDKSSTSNRSKTPDSDRSGASTPDKDRSRPSDKDLSPMVVEKEEPEVRSPPMMKAPKAGMPGGMPGMGGLLAEMKQKRKTMHPAADDKKEKKEPVTKEAIPTRPPPPSSSQNRSSQRPYSVYANDSKLIASPNSGKGDKPDEKGDDVSSNGSFGKGRPAVPARLKPPLVPPKPRPVSTASALTPNPSPEVSPNPKSKAPQPPKKFSEPDESTDQADSPPEPTVRRRSSVRDKVSLLDRNSNEKQPIESKQKSSTLPSGDQPTDTDVPQRSLSTGSQSTNTPHRLSAFTQSSSKKADDRDNSDGDLKPNGNAAKSEEAVFV